MEDNPFYSLRDSKTYFLFKLFKKRKLEPTQAMKDILQSATLSGGYSPKMVFPNLEARRLMAVKFLKSKNLTKDDLERTFMAGCKAAIRNMKEKNTVEHYLEHEAKHKLNRPIDLTLRQLAFVTKATGLPSIKRLISSIAKGISPESGDMIKVKNWKRYYKRERDRHDETKNRLGQIFDEGEASKRILAELRTLLHEKGLQDPTLQTREEGGENPIAAIDKKDDSNGDS